VLFTKRLRDDIIRGRITCTVRIWKWSHVTLHGRYAMGRGYVEVDSIREIALSDIDDDLGRRCGFKDAGDLLKVAQHGRGELVYLIDFHYVEGRRPQMPIGRGARRRVSRSRVKRLV
jgi:hypothetical protein